MKSAETLKSRSTTCMTIHVHLCMVFVLDDINFVFTRSLQIKLFQDLAVGMGKTALIMSTSCYDHGKVSHNHANILTRPRSIYTHTHTHIQEVHTHVHTHTHTHTHTHKNHIHVEAHPHTRGTCTSDHTTIATISQHELYTKGLVHYTYCTRICTVYA